MLRSPKKQKVLLGVFLLVGVYGEVSRAADVKAFRLTENSLCTLNSAGQVTCVDPEGKRQVLISKGVLELTSGNGFFCARMSNGEIKCWGKNNFGQLGRITVSDADPQPGNVEFDQDLSKNPIEGMTSGDNHSCAILRDQSLHCWGDGLREQLGVRFPYRDMAYEELGTRSATSTWDDVVSGFRGFYYGVFRNGQGQAFLQSQKDEAERALERRVTEVIERHRGRLWRQSESFQPRNEKIRNLHLLSGATCIQYVTGEIVCVGTEPRNLLLLEREQPSNNFVIVQPDGERIRQSGGRSVPFTNGRVNQIDFGSTHACAVTLEGNVICWGSGDGVGAEDKSAPLDAAEPGLFIGSQELAKTSGIRKVDLGSDPQTPASMVRVNGNTTCVANLLDQFRCWGSVKFLNMSGPLLSSDEALFDMTAEEPIADFQINENNICALTVSGKLYCRGKIVERLSPEIDSSAVPVFVDLEKENEK